MLQLDGTTSPGELDNRLGHRQLQHARCRRERLLLLQRQLRPPDCHHVSCFIFYDVHFCRATRMRDATHVHRAVAGGVCLSQNGC